MILDPATTGLIGLEYNGPSLRSMYEWLHRRFGDHMLRNLLHLKVKGVIRAHNVAIRDYALKRDWTDVIFFENDVCPTQSTAKFLEGDEDIVCCRARLDNPNAWTGDNPFHMTLWRAKVEALRKIEPPWSMMRYTDDGCAHDGCNCAYFRDKALAAGLTIAARGVASHKNSNSRLCGV